MIPSIVPPQTEVQLRPTTAALASGRRSLHDLTKVGLVTDTGLPSTSQQYLSISQSPARRQLPSEDAIIHHGPGRTLSSDPTDTETVCRQ